MLCTNSLFNQICFLGGGCESQMYYSQWKYVNGNIVRIGAIREALARLVDGANLQLLKMQNFIKFRILFKASQFIQ